MFRLRMIALAAAVFVPAALALTAPTAGQQNTTIGVSLAQDDNPFYIAMLRGIRARAQELGWDVATVSANEDKLKQINGVQDLVARGVKGILISPIDAVGVNAAYDAAAAAKIPIVSVARGSASPNQTIHQCPEILVRLYTGSRGHRDLHQARGAGPIADRGLEQPDVSRPEREDGDDVHQHEHEGCGRKAQVDLECPEGRPHSEELRRPAHELEEEGGDRRPGPPPDGQPVARHPQQAPYWPKLLLERARVPAREHDPCQE